MLKSDWSKQVAYIPYTTRKILIIILLVKNISWSMRPSLVVSSDTNNGEVAAVQQPCWSTSIQASVDSKATWEASRCIARARSRYGNVIIGRWGLPWNLLSEQSRSKTEQSSKLRRAKQSSVGDSSYSLCCWTVHGYGNTSRSRSAAAACVHMTRLLWSKFVRHCLVGFYVI